MRTIPFLLTTLPLFMVVACTGTRPLNLGVKEGKLAPCPSTPNCVSSQSSDKEHSIEPLAYTGYADRAPEGEAATVKVGAAD